MLRLSLKSEAIQYVLFGASFMLFWLVYYYFGNHNLGLSITLAFLDTIQYMIAYYVVVSFLLAWFLLHRNWYYFISGFLFLTLLTGTTRVGVYQLATSYFHVPFSVSISSLLYIFTTTTFVLSAISGVRFAIDLLQSQKRIEEINKERATSELEFLKGQLNPHFFFNSINTLYGSIHPENETARNILIKLSDMLRYQLYECGTDHVSLEREAQYVHNYVELQKLRSQHRLQIEVDIDQDLLSIAVPPLLLAPLVENAFKHVSKFPDRQNWIGIFVHKFQNGINIIIRNSFEIDPRELPPSVGGIGLANIQKRLALIYGNRFELTIERSNNVFEVNLKLDT